MFKSITFMRVALSFVIAICFAFLPLGSMTVHAFESEENLYPINVEDARITIVDTNMSTIYGYGVAFDPDSNGFYQLSNGNLNNIKFISWGDPNGANQFLFPCNLSEFEYYLIGSLDSVCSDVELSTFKPTKVSILYYDVVSGSNKYYPASDVDIYNIDTVYSKGFGFSRKLLFDDVGNAGISLIQFTDDKDGFGSKPANLRLQMAIMAIPIGTDAADVSRQILNKLSEMETSINQSILNMQGTINDNFSSLQEQNAAEHEELINGYQGNDITVAGDKFDQGAEELESVEADLTNITNTSIDNYATAAFDTSIITTLGPSLVYVVTWFTNFWNMGGIFTSLLNVGLALFVAFFILRLHGGK